MRLIDAKDTTTEEEDDLDDDEDEDDDEDDDEDEDDARSKAIAHARMLRGVVGAGITKEEGEAGGEIVEPVVGQCGILSLNRVYKNSSELTPSERKKLIFGSDQIKP